MHSEKIMYPTIQLTSIHMIASTGASAPNPT